jgi:hypothetical protein
MSAQLIAPAGLGAVRDGEDLEVQLADQEWVDAECLAILQASGFDVPRAVGIVASPASSTCQTSGIGRELVANALGERVAGDRTRVRSPPAQH